MDTIKGSSRTVELRARTGGLSRRAVLQTATVAAGAVASASAALSDNVSAAGFGAPLVELHVPVGVLAPEQKRAMIEGVTEVLVSAIKLPPDQAKRLFVQIFETAEGGWGVGGQVFVTRNK
jgi:phenylpyruvate tautomerase PptA (4-oxalocrotonate tautomerase family)